MGGWRASSRKMKERSVAVESRPARRSWMDWERRRRGSLVSSSISERTEYFGFAWSASFVSGFIKASRGGEEMVLISCGRACLFFNACATKWSAQVWQTAHALRNFLELKSQYSPCERTRRASVSCAIRNAPSKERSNLPKSVEGKTSTSSFGPAVTKAASCDSTDFPNSHSVAASSIKRRKSGARSVRSVHPSSDVTCNAWKSLWMCLSAASKSLIFSRENCGLKIALECSHMAPSAVKVPYPSSGPNC